VTALLELVRWWGLATGVSFVLLVLLVLVQSLERRIRRGARRGQPAGSAQVLRRSR
jgi:hypothetical protein